MNLSRSFLDVKNLSVQFPAPRQNWFTKNRFITAVDRVDFQIGQQETLGLVGESGCGKSTLARTLLRLITPTAGEIYVEGVEISDLTKDQIKHYCRSIQAIFQDPVASLDPRMTAGQIIAEPLRTLQPHLTKREIDRRVRSIMDRVGLRMDQINNYPHHFSGGQCQRIGIARALIGQPRLIVCDEPVSALDVSIKAQIINLLARLQREFGLSLLFISHDLTAIRHICDRVMVMYLGEIVEVNDTDALFEKPLHPYTQALINAIPSMHSRGKYKAGKNPVQGELASAMTPPGGCRFHPRCPDAMEICRSKSPEMRLIHTGSYARVACHLLS